MRHPNRGRPAVVSWLCIDGDAMRTTAFLAALAAAAAGTAVADYRVDMNAIDVKGVGAPVGTVVISEDAGGVRFAPDLHGLQPGTHGFHVHEFPNCAAREKDGKVVAGELAGNHWDPDHHGRHAAPGQGGHRGDLPPLKVGADGRAHDAVVVKGLKLSQLRSKSLVVHAGGDNGSDQPKPNGGGGDRIACGVIQAGEKP